MDIEEMGRLCEDPEGVFARRTFSEAERAEKVARNLMNDPDPLLPQRVSHVPAGPVRDCGRASLPCSPHKTASREACHARAHSR